LRKKIERPNAPLIRTARGAGYILSVDEE